MNGTKEVPIGVKIISIIYYLGTVVGVILGLFFIIPVGVFFEGIILFGLGILSFFVARGLLKLRPWARVLAIILSCLGILMAVFSIAYLGGILGNIFTIIFSLLFELLTGGYLLFNNNVKKAFS